MKACPKPGHLAISNCLFDARFAPHEVNEAVFLHLPNGETISDKAFPAIAGRMAKALSATNVRPGDRVAFQIAESPEALAT